MIFLAVQADESLHSLIPEITRGTFTESEKNNFYNQRVACLKVFQDPKPPPRNLKIPKRVGAIGKANCALWTDFVINHHQFHTDADPYSIHL